MPTYEYRCTTCDSVFEQRRSMADSDAPATCDQGHPARRLLSVFASTGASGGPAPSAPMPSGGCGGGCACAH